MAIVKDQTLPTQNIETDLDPPIEFLDQYKKTLALPSPHPGLPAGEEILTATKKGSRTDTTDQSATFLSAATVKQRDAFKSCLDCWRTQVDTDADIDPCFSAQSKHYIKPWVYVPGAPYPFFRQFMSDCLKYLSANPGSQNPPCENLLPDPATFDFCPGETITFTAPNGKDPFIESANCGAIAAELQWEAPATFDDCPDTATITFIDSDGRRGCSIGIQNEPEECCCIDPPPLAISYTSLQMSCDEEQELTIDPLNPGCPPYVWSLTGGGSLDPTEGETVLYTAPSENPDCANNATITVSDSCDQQAQINIAVNCAGADWLYLTYKWEIVAELDCDVGLKATWFWVRKLYQNCDGTTELTEPFLEYYTIEPTPPIIGDTVRCTWGQGPSGLCYTCPEHFLPGQFYSFNHSTFYHDKQEINPYAPSDCCPTEPTP